jgi:hypothetical protein
MSSLIDHTFSPRDMANISSWSYISDDECNHTKSIILNMIGTLRGMPFSSDAKCKVSVKPSEKDFHLVVYPQYQEQEEKEAEKETKNYELDIFGDGVVSMLQELVPVNVEDMEKLCELKEFPFATSDGKMMIINKATQKVMLGQEEVNHVYLEEEPNESHQALCVYNIKDPNPYIARDKWMRLPSFDIGDDLLAFVFSRHAWGMNLHYALFEISTCTLYHGISHNYDHPVGVALRVKQPIQNDLVLELFLDNDEVSRKMLYSCPLDRPKVFGFRYANSGWKTWISARSEIEQLGKLIEYKRTNVDFTKGAIEYLQEINQKFQNEIESKKYIESIIVGLKYLKFPGYTRYSVGGFFNSSPPTYMIVMFNMACAHSQLGQLDVAMSYLQKLNDFKDKNEMLWTSINTDKDLDPLRVRDNFKALIITRHSP